MINFYLTFPHVFENKRKLLGNIFFLLTVIYREVFVLLIVKLLLYIVIYKKNGKKKINEVQTYMKIYKVIFFTLDFKIRKVTYYIVLQLESF